MSSIKKVNIKLLPVKAHYFFFNGASSSLWPFVPVIGKQMGISAEAVGIVYAIAPIVACVSKPFFGLIADRLKKRKKTFLFFLLLALTSSLSIAFLPQAMPERPVLFECGNLGTSYLRQCGGSPSNCSTESNFTALSYSTKAGEADVCHIRCEIHTFLEGINFCSNLYMEDGEENVPEYCRRTTKSPISQISTTTSIKSTTAKTNLNNDDENSSENEALNSTNGLNSSLKTNEPQLESLSPNLQIKSGAPPNLIQLDPFNFKFDVSLKLSSLSFIGSCLFLPIEGINFVNNTQNSPKYHPFSCLPHGVNLTNCFADCPFHPHLNSRLERVLEDPETFESSNFWLYGILVVLAFTALAVSTSISDALCFQVLEDKPENYGMQRQWGAIGWGIFTLVAGYLIDTNSRGKLLKDYTPSFYLLGVLYVFDLIVAYKYEIKEDDKPKQIRRDMWNLVTDLRIIVFVFACMIVGMCTGIHWQFLFWYIEDVADKNCGVLEWMKVLQGVMVAVQCFSELPFFYFSGWFLRKLGYVHSLTLVLFAFGIRFIIYSLLNTPWAFVPIELFQGITFGLFYATMTSYAFSISPPGAASTVQGLVGASFEGIGVAAGSFVGGILMSTWGGAVAYRSFGVGALIFSLLHFLLTHFLTKSQNYGVPINQSEPEGQDMYKMNEASPEDEEDEDSP